MALADALPRQLRRRIDNMGVVFGLRDEPPRVPHPQSGSHPRRPLSLRQRDRIVVPLTSRPGRQAPRPTAPSAPRPRPSPRSDALLQPVLSNGARACARNVVIRSAALNAWVSCVSSSVRQARPSRSHVPTCNWNSLGCSRGSATSGLAGSLRARFRPLCAAVLGLVTSRPRLAGSSLRRPGSPLDWGGCRQGESGERRRPPGSRSVHRGWLRRGSRRQRRCQHVLW